ncbi:SRF-type transcription factor (DNA-binding and dimerization domain) [Ceratobasidium sp. AG-Ba]|nr:SRF-type transcription factor (DNA-binding and dimerization domain) [Ceratobasidium sp. AG-Ba]
MATSPRSKRPRPPDLHTGSAAGLPATTGAPASSGPTSAGFTPASATAGGDDVFHQEDGEDAEDDDEEEGGRKGSEKKAGRRKIKIEFIQDKSRRHITFSKRKAGIMKKASRSPSRHALALTALQAYELSTLTGTQVLLLVVSETGLVYTFTTAKLQPLVTQPEGKNLIQACLNAPNGSIPGGAPASGPGMPPPPPTRRGNLSMGVNNATSPDEGDEDGEGSGDSPNMGSSKGRQRRRTNSSSGAVAMNRSISSPSESLPATSPTLGMQQPQGVSGGAPYNGHPAAHSPTLGQPHHHPHHPHMAESGMYAGYRGGEGGAAGAGMMPTHHYQYSGMNAAGMASGLNAGSVPGGAIGQGAGQQQQSQSQMWMQQGNMQRR